MGLGDEIMAAGHAKAEHAKRGTPAIKIEICDKRERPRWHDLWAGLPYIRQPGESVSTHKIVNGPNCRPYIRYPFSQQTGWTWADWRARDHVGDIALCAHETQPGQDLAQKTGGYYVIEPNQKPSASINRCWSWQNYSALVKELTDITLLQLPLTGQPRLPGVRSIECDFRTACGYLQAAHGYIGADGGFHHAAAALGIDAVVIFGGCTSEQHLGYPTHRNIVSDLPGTPCGSWLECDHCAHAMRAITVDRVLAEVRQMIAGTPRDAPPSPKTLIEPIHVTSESPPTTVIVPTEKTSPLVGRAFAEGCCGPIQDTGIRSIDDSATSLALFGSPPLWPLLQRWIASGRDWFFIDKGYLRRGKYFRITKNAYQYQGDGGPDYARLDRLHVTIQPWRKTGRHIVICPNSPLYFRLFGFDADNWVNALRTTLATVTDRPIRVRWKRDKRPLIADLRNAWTLIAWSSVAALEALAAGIPVCVTAPHAAAYRMGIQDCADIESPRYPDNRREWFGRLAAQQWTLQEIRSGQAWEALRHEPG